MTSVPPTQPPAAPETDVRLTEAEREPLERSLRWHFACHAQEPDKSYASLGVENALLIVERIVAERVRVVEGERDAARADHHVVHQSNHTTEIVCSCGVVLSVYGLTRSLASVFGEHVRTARALLAGGGAR